MKSKLSIIIPVYNESDTILDILDIVKKVPLKNIEKEIIIVDDYSTDGTRVLLRKIKDKSVKVIFHDKNCGKGSAIRTALVCATGDFTIIQDADLEYNPNEYYKLLGPLLNGEADVVYGFRNLKNRHYYASFYMGVKFLTSLANFLYGMNITDEATCYKVFRTDLLKSLNLKCNKFEFCPEVTAKIGKRKIKIVEVPISYNPRKFEEGKKIKAFDGVVAIWTLLKYKFID